MSGHRQVCVLGNGIAENRSIRLWSSIIFPAAKYKRHTYLLQVERYCAILFDLLENSSSHISRTRNFTGSRVLQNTLHDFSYKWQLLIKQTQKCNGARISVFKPMPVMAMELQIYGLSRTEFYCKMCKSNNICHQNMILNRLLQ